MIHLTITRHGQTEENVKRILQGQMPGHLTDEGIRQAEQLRELLRHQHFDRIITSDLKRAVDTARIIAEPHQCPIEEDSLLRERDFGIHTGGPYIKISHALDPSAETIDHVALRARQFLIKVNALAHSRSLSILVVSHGLFLRVLQSVFFNIPTHDVPKMENAEIRLLTLEPHMRFNTGLLEETGGSAN